MGRPEPTFEYELPQESTKPTGRHRHLRPNFACKNDRSFWFSAAALSSHTLRGATQWLARTLTVILVFASCAAEAQQPRPQPKLALVIGVSDYERVLTDEEKAAGFVVPRSLPNARRDAGLVADALSAQGFVVTRVTDPTKSVMIAALSSFSSALQRAGPDAIGVFYFAGHGAQGRPAFERDIDNYLIPKAADLTTEIDLESEALALSRVSASLRPGPRGAIVLILDACRDFALPAANRSGAVTRGLAESRAAPGTLIAYATSPGATASDGPPGTNGPYAKALAVEVRNARGASLEQIFIAVRNKVLEETSDTQVPWENSSLRNAVALGVPDTSEADRLREQLSVVRGNQVIERSAATTAVVSELDALARRARPSVVQVHWSGRKANGEQVFGTFSGFFVTEDGYIVSSQLLGQVVGTIRISLLNGLSLPAQLVGVSEEHGVSVLKVDGGRFPALSWDTRLTIGTGEVVMAIATATIADQSTRASPGTVMGYGNTISSGSARMMQLNIPVSQISAGGPVLSREGKVIGVLQPTFGIPQDSAIGFAMPAMAAMRASESIIKGGALRRGYLGLSIAPPDYEDFIAGRGNAVVKNVVANGPGARAGLAVGDFIISVNGVTVENATEAMSYWRDAEIGAEIELIVRRGARLLQIRAKVEERPPEQIVR